MQYKGLKEILDKIERSVRPKKTPEEEQAEIRNNWVRLASVMKGQK